MQSGEYYNRQVVEWASQNISGRVNIKPLLSSLVGKILVYSLVFCVPAAFFAIGVVALILGVRDRSVVLGAFVFGFILMIP